MSHLYIYHGKNTRKTSACRPVQKAMLMHRIETPRAAVELAKVHRAILFRDAAPVQSCRADCRNIACSCGICGGNRYHQLRQDLRPISK